MSVFTALFLVLLVLKLVGVIGVSWWVVFAPLLVVLVFFIILFVVPSIIIWRNK